MNKQVFTVTASTAKGERVNKTFTFISKYGEVLSYSINLLIFNCFRQKLVSSV